MLRVLESVVSHPTDFVCLLTGNSGDFPPQTLGKRGNFLFAVRVNFVGKKKGKKLTKFCNTKLYSTYLAPLSTENRI